MKSLFFQYEKDWPQLHPFVRAAFVGGELLRIQPFGQHSALCAWLVLTGEFLCAGYPPPVIAQDKTEELGAALAMKLPASHQAARGCCGIPCTGRRVERIVIP